MPGPLTGLHALVTGAGRGIGAAIVRTLAAAGADITLLGRSQPALAGVAAALGAVRRSCQVADVSNAESVRAAIGAARAAIGPITVLVNNAGQALSGPLGATDDALWQSMLSVNLTGTFLCMRECLPDMLKAGFGRIVNVASTAGLVGYPYEVADTVRWLCLRSTGSITGQSIAVAGGEVT